jgi:hypothetical protein
MGIADDTGGVGAVTWLALAVFVFGIAITTADR